MSLSVPLLSFVCMYILCLSFEYFYLICSLGWYSIILEYVFVISEGLYLKIQLVNNCAS